MEFPRKASSWKQSFQKASWCCLSAYCKARQNYVPSDHPSAESYSKTLKASSSTPDAQCGNMGLEQPPSSLTGKNQVSKLGASSRSQTVIHQHHPCHIEINSKLGKDALDAENKTGNVLNFGLNWMLNILKQDFKNNNSSTLPKLLLCNGQKK